jgi:colanic acid biosynthesis glycosyl transferase WcaI
VARALLLTEFLPPESFAGAKRVGAMATGIASVHDLTVVALRPSYPSAALYDEEETEAHDRVVPYRVRRTFVFTPHASSLVVRAARELAMAVRLAAAAVREPADAVVTSSPSMFLGPAGFLLARVRSAQFCWDVRDVTWSYGIEVSASPLSRAAARALARCMWWTARRADTILTTSRGMSRRFIEAGVNEHDVLVVPNMVDGDLIRSAAAMDAPDDDRPRVTYAGLVGKLQGLGVLLDVARARPRVEFVIAGDGPERGLLERRAAAARLENVTIVPYLAQDELARLYASSRILFAQVLDTPTLRDTALPSKVYEYMAFAKPVVYAGSGVGKALIDRLGCGECVPPGDAAAIAKAIDRLLEQPSLGAAMGLRGRRFVEAAEPRDETMRKLGLELGRRWERAGRT